jgi:hypothetical protein
VADRYWRGTTSTDWSNTNNWSDTSGGSTGFSAPSSADNVFFDANGNNPCTLTSVSNFCLSFVMSNGYTSTFNHNTRTLNVTGTILTLSSAMTYTATTGVFNFSQTGTITLNGNTVNNFTAGLFGGTSTITFVGTNNIVNFTRSGNAASTIFSGGTVNISGNLSVAGQNSGTTLFRYVGGTGTWSGTGVLPTLEIVSGTLTLSGTVGCPSILTYLGGTIDTSGSTLSIQGNTTLNTSGINWLNVSFTNFVSATATLTLLSNFNVTGNVNCNSTNGILNIVNSGGSWLGCGGVLSNSIAFTLNLANPITCNGITSSLQQWTINNHSVTNTGNLTVGSGLVGTSKVILSGTGTWSGASLINMDMDINTAGTITLSGALVIFGQQGSGVNPRFNYITGTINQGSTIFRMEEGRYDMAGVTWSNLITGTNGTIVTLLADINCVNFTPNSGCILNGAFNLNVSGNFSPPQTVSGTGTIRMVGTGTWLGGGAVNCNLVFDTAGTITIGSIVNFGASSGVATMTYTTGTILTAGSTLTLRTSSVNTGILQWNNVIITTSPTITLLSNLLVYGLLTINNSNTTLNTSNGSKICCFDGFTLGNINVIGTSSIELVGSGTLTGTQTSGLFQIPLIINTLGTITLSGTINYRNSTFTHTSGTVNAGTSTLTLGQATNFVINNTGFALNNLNPSTFNVTFSGTNGCTINNFSAGVVTAGVTHTFQSLNTYNIATLQVIGTIGSPATIRSSTPSSQAILTLTNASNNYMLNVTDINSGLGAAGFTSGGILTNATNWTTAAAALYYIGSTNYSGTNLWSVTSGGSPITAITAPTSSDPVIFDTNSGNCIMNVAGVAGSVNFTNYTNTITFSNSLTVSGNITLGSGMIILGTGTLAVNGSSTLTSNGVIFPNTLELRATATYTLADNWTIRTLNIPVNATTITLNGNTLFLTNYTFSNTNKHQGSTIIYFNGYFGDGVFNSNDYAFNTTIIDTPNTLVIGNLVQLANGASFTLTHIQGSIIHTGAISIGRLATWTLSFLPNVELNTLTIVTPITTINLNSDITVRNLYFDGANTTITTITINGNYTIFTKGDCAFSSALGFTNVPIVGTAKISLIGSGFLFSSASAFNWQTFSIELQIEINTNGIIRLSNNFVYLANLSYIKGNIVSRDFSSFIFRTGANIRGAGRMNLNRVSIVGGATITMDEFFSGTPQIPTVVTSTTTANYIINFTDGFEKLAKNVRVSRCTISRRGQLLLLSKGGFGVNNIGIRYYNQSPNGVSTDTQKFVNNNLAGMPALRAVNMLVGDPVFT